MRCFALQEITRQTVEDTLNGLLEEADDLVGAERYERTAGREAYRVGHYDRKLVTTSGEVKVRMPKLKGMSFTTAIIGAAEGFTESGECWKRFLSWLRSRGLRGVRMFTGDKAAGMVGALAEVFPDGKSALMLVTAHLKYVADSEWGSRRYLDVSLLEGRSCRRATGA